MFRFKMTFSRPAVTVHFGGVWCVVMLRYTCHIRRLNHCMCRDTVSSIGLVRDKTLPNTTSGMKFVCYFRHALALDECRVKFLPEYAYGGLGPDEVVHDMKNGHLKEVWFAGSHSDVYVLLCEFDCVC